MTFFQYWMPGEIIVFRGVVEQKIQYALPVIVVQDDPNLTALFWRAGTMGKFRRLTPGEKVTPQHVISGQMKVFDKTWIDTDVLMLVPYAAAYAVYVMWKEGQKRLNCWYINLQQPLERTTIGFNTIDQNGIGKTKNNLRKLLL